MPRDARDVLVSWWTRSVRAKAAELGIDLTLESIEVGSGGIRSVAPVVGSPETLRIGEIPEPEKWEGSLARGSMLERLQPTGARPHVDSTFLVIIHHRRLLDGDVLVRDIKNSRLTNVFVFDCNGFDSASCWASLESLRRHGLDGVVRTFGSAEISRTLEYFLNQQVGSKLLDFARVLPGSQPAATNVRGEKEWRPTQPPESGRVAGIGPLDRPLRDVGRSHSTQPVAGVDPGARPPTPRPSAIVGPVSPQMEAESVRQTASRLSTEPPAPLNRPATSARRRLLHTLGEFLHGRILRGDHGAPDDQRDDRTTPDAPEAPADPPAVPDPSGGGQPSDPLPTDATDNGVTGAPVSERAVNGQLVVEEHSSVNKKVWWSPSWIKVPMSGPSRDAEIEYGGVGALRMMAGSVRGTRHQFYGEPNQDAFSISRNDCFVVVAVCDGVGSAEHSAYGSKYLSNSVSRSLASSLVGTEPTDVEAVKSWMTAAVQQASDRVQTWEPGALYAPDLPTSEVERADLSATLVVAVVAIEPDGDGRRNVVVANVGDSPCYTLIKGIWTIRTAPTKDGELLEHATTALPVEVGAPVSLDWREFSLQPSEQLVVMTDGIGTSLASGRTPVGAWLAERLSRPQLAQDWLDTLTFDRQGEDDDRTLVVLYDVDHAFIPAESSDGPPLQPVEHQHVSEATDRTDSEFGETVPESPAAKELGS